MVPKPGLVIHSMYNGYWFWGWLSFAGLYRDLREVTREIRPDWGLATPGLRETGRPATGCIIGIRTVRPRTVRHNSKVPNGCDPRSSPRLTVASPPATELRDKERPMAVSFATNIRPMFTDMDIAHMKNFGVLLDDFGFMRDPANAQKVLNAVSSGAMPPSDSGETSWSPDQVELFRNWITGGYQA